MYKGERNLILTNYTESSGKVFREKNVVSYFTPGIKINYTLIRN